MLQVFPSVLLNCVHVESAGHVNTWNHILTDPVSSNFLHVLLSSARIHTQRNRTGTLCFSYVYVHSNRFKMSWYSLKRYKIFSETVNWSFLIQVNIKKILTQFSYTYLHLFGSIIKLFSPLQVSCFEICSI